MFTIQYLTVNGSSQMQEVDSHSRGRLLVCLVKFERPILAVYENSTVITKTMQSKLRTWRGDMTRYAREFMIHR